MKYLLGIIAIPLIATQECCNQKSKSQAENGKGEGKVISQPAIPSCVKKTIDEASRQSAAERPVQIDEYTYQGKTVYLYTAPCCDQYNTLYDGNCQPICAPSGGFTGKGDGKCADFANNAKHVRMIWKSPDKK